MITTRWLASGARYSFTLAIPSYQHAKIVEIQVAQYGPRIKK